MVTAGGRSIIADASPLIAFAKLRQLRLLSRLYGRVLIGPVVKAETVDAGLAIRASGVEQLEAALEDGLLQVVQLTSQERDLMQRLAERSRLDSGEAESIALASVRCLRLILDDKAARGVAATAEVEHLGTAAVMLEAYLRNLVNLDDLESMLQDLSQIIWLSPTVVAELLGLARRYRETTR